MPAEVEWFDDLDAVARDAGGALDRGTLPCLFDRLDWFRLVERYAPPPGKLLVLRAQSDERRAWLFLKVAGGKARALANWYSLRFGIVGDGGLADALIASLHRKGIALAELYPLDSADRFGAAFRKAGWLTWINRASANWRMETGGRDFAAYWASRPAQLRHTAERRARSAGLQIEIHDRFDPATWADYLAVYQASWKPAEGSPEFLRALAEMEGAAGTLRLGIARKEEQPVAAQLWLVEAGVATIHKLAHAEEAKPLSPGTVLSMAMFRHALDVDRVGAIDFGLGDDAYKADWIDRSDPVYRLAAYDLTSLRGLAAVSRAAASKLVRRSGSG